MDERDKLIELLIEEKGGSREDYLRLLDSIAYHESAHTLDPKMKQMGGGPGRGKYQFEVGKNAGGITAARRTRQYLEKKNIPVPKWLETVTKGDDLDATNLTGEQQDILFLGNMRQHPHADFSKIWDGSTSVVDFWADYHWAGSERERAKRVKSFKSSLDHFNTNYVKPNKDGTTSRTTVYNDASRPLFRRDVAEPVAKELKPMPIEELETPLFSLGATGVKGQYDKTANLIGAGGLHETNPHGGVRLGNLGLAEEKEVSYNFSNKQALLNNMYVKPGKTIFSNRIYF